ncbi:TraR/DksA C4-type zinc finger protein [Actinotalea sp. C106]|uniref:TraR/DksA family transcriptional regulator n=1 Tax=Actinotalea sp. C106 TaxID=2908644 RepID=UPI002027CE9C|nr:TraR/DksA C4-type zinc finger protein [Actinotalea sp. C106]
MVTLEELRGLRQQAARQLAALDLAYADLVATSAGSNADDEHDPEGTTIAFERSQLGALVDQARRRLAELDEAQTRWLAGQYGDCERCGSPIPADRLEARPSARTCVGCAADRR